MAELNQEVTRLIQEMDPGRENLLRSLRQVVLDSSAEISEHIKWNSPAYRYDGDLLIDDPKKYTRDVLVFNLRNRKHILLIFPSGVHVSGISPLLTGDFADGRRMMTISSQDELSNAEPEIHSVITAWINAVKP